MNILTKTARGKSLPLLCIALLLAAVLVQAMHFCGPQLNSSQSGPHWRAETPNSTLCLTCLLSQSVATAVLAIVFSSIRRQPVLVSPVRMRPRSFLQSFQLYVRPPPAL